MIDFKGIRDKYLTHDVICDNPEECFQCMPVLKAVNQIQTATAKAVIEEVEVLYSGLVNEVNYCTSECARCTETINGFYDKLTSLKQSFNIE